MFRIIAALSIFQIATVAVNIARSKLVALILGPEGVGIISVVDQAVILVAQLSALSLPFAALKFLSRSHSRGEAAFHNTYSAFLKAVLTLTVLGSVISLTLLLRRPTVFGQELIPYRNLLLPGLLGVPAITLHGFFVHVFAALRRTRGAALMMLFIAVALLAAAAIGILWMGIAGFYWATLAANYLVIAVAFVYLRRYFRLSFLAGDQSIRRELQANPDIAFFTVVVFVASYAQPVSHFVARYSVLANFGEGTTGLLQAAIGLALAINLLLNPANGLYLTPILNRESPLQTKIEAALEFYRKLTLVMHPLAVGLVLFGPLALTILYSRAFTAVSAGLYLFIIAQCLMQLVGINQAFMLGTDELKAYAALVPAGQLSLAALAWLLAPQYGVAGVGFAFLASALLLLLLTHFHLRRQHGLRLPRKSWVLFFYMILSLLVAGWLSATRQLDSLGAYVLRALIYAGFLVTLVPFLTKREMMALRAAAMPSTLLSKSS